VDVRGATRRERRDTAGGVRSKHGGVAGKAAAEDVLRAGQAQREIEAGLPLKCF